MIQITSGMTKGFAIGVYSTILLTIIGNTIEMGFNWPALISAIGFIVVIISFIVDKEEGG